MSKVTEDGAVPGVVGQDGYYPVVVGRGSAVHLAYGHGMTVCGLGTRNLHHAVTKVPADRITCQRCLKMGAKGWTPPEGADE